MRQFAQTECVPKARKSTQSLQFIIYGKTTDKL